MKFEYECTLPNGTRLEPGIEFALKGERGKKYRFIKLVTNENGEQWIDCFGGTTNHQQSRSVFMDRVKLDSIRKPKVKK